MIVKINVSGLGKAEAAARAVLEHVEAIRQLMSRDLSPLGISVTVDLAPEDGKEADSGN